MKTLARKRTSDRAIGADQPNRESKLLGNWQREGMSAPGDQQDLYTAFVGLAQSLKIRLGDVELRIQEGAINVNGEKTDYGKGHWKNSSIAIAHVGADAFARPSRDEGVRGYMA